MYPRTYSSEWDFKNVNTKEYTHGYHNYPAMMIPQIARKLLNEYHKEVYKTISPYLNEDEKEWLKQATREI